jgi:hypothetical protein
VRRRGAALLAAAALLGCGGEPEVPEGPSPAADALIERAETPEERAALEAERDRVDAEKRAEAKALDEEIERLRRENAELRGD